MPEEPDSGEPAAQPADDAHPAQPDLGPFSLDRTTSFEIPDEAAHAADASGPAEIDMREPSTAMALKVRALPDGPWSTSLPGIHAVMRRWRRP